MCLPELKPSDNLDDKLDRHYNRGSENVNSCNSDTFSNCGINGSLGLLEGLGYRTHTGGKPFEGDVNDSGGHPSYHTGEKPFV